eukprot:TRINITY_DN779_c0_g1_i1.p1 TRINITY_DN779_c0_g1~~TRINITY_DN779_c0_g1_i1.p1  ORF type:complete len:279 (-),score=57.72 TRINITY_DN779_c0_g1_i1:40-876(-)
MAEVEHTNVPTQIPPLESDGTHIDEYSVDLTSDPRDRISAAEYETLQLLKSKGVTEGLSDKLVMIFLFGRKMNAERTAELLGNNRKWMQENNYSWEDPLKLSQMNPKLVQTMYNYTIPGCRSRGGHGISYLIPSRLVWKDFEMKDLLDYLVYSIQQLAITENLDAYRKGFVYVEDIGGINMKFMRGFDMKKGKHLNLAVQNNFPMRIQGIYIINSGFFLKGLIKIARLFVKKKIIDRVKVIKHPQDLHDLIDKSQLHSDFWGDIHFTADDILGTESSQ